MEQKKLLWIIFSAVGFVLIVAVAGLIWFWPQGKSAGTAVAAGGGKEKKEFDPIEWVRESGDYPGLEQPSQKPKSEDFTIVYGDSGETGQQTSPAEAGKEQSQGDAAEHAAVAKDGLPAAPPLEEKKDNIKIEVYNPKAEPKKTEPARTAAVHREEQKPAPPKIVRVREYWIQTGSYTSMAHAEDVKNKLGQKGVASIITSKTIGSTDYYRVRIGPYAEKGEAEKFLGWVQGINGFESSYVSLVYAQKKIN